MSQKRIKKLHLALLVAAIAVMVVGISSLSNSYEANSTYTPKISKETAAKIAVSYLGAQPSQVTQIELDNENGVHVYSIEIIKDNLEDDVKIDPQTGEVKGVEQGPIETSDEETDDDTNGDTETNDGKSVSDGDGETDDDTTD